MDNHPAHKTPQSLALLRELKFEPLFFPSYSCEFNSVEHVWALCKQKLRLLLAENVRAMTIDELTFDRFVQSALTHPPATFFGLIQANRKFMEQMFKDLQAG
jgi:hypothetical protein